MNSFGQSAKDLSRSPLGIIALFIVLVYGLAALVTAFASSLTQAERTPLIWFLVVFPILVLVAFTWLVSRHSENLFAPRDFENEDNYVKIHMTTAASLAAASTKSGQESSDTDIDTIVDTVRHAPSLKVEESDDWRGHVLWVDDRPENNVYERKAFESYGIRFTIALRTGAALDLLKHNKYAAIISDMGREEGEREGYVLLDEIRRHGNTTPFVIYAGSNLPEHKREAAQRGAQGSTNNPQELFQLVMKAVVAGT